MKKKTIETEVKKRRKNHDIQVEREEHQTIIKVEIIKR